MCLKARKGKLTRNPESQTLTYTFYTHTNVYHDYDAVSKNSCSSTNLPKMTSSMFCCTNGIWEVEA
jgi:hypothetical protein